MSSLSPISSPPRVAIIGAGPAGTLLARLLLLASIPCTVYERDTSISARAQGGSLDLSPKGGLAAFKDAGLYEEFQKYARYDGEAFVMADKFYKKWLDVEGASSKEESEGRPDGGRPEIDRVKLRGLLVECLPEGVVKWGWKLVRVVAEEEDDGDKERVVLEFEGGKVERGFDLVVGADGAWSKVRPALTEVVPYYTGTGGFDMVIKEAAERAPEVDRMVNRGSMIALGNGRMLMGQQKGDRSIIVYAWGRRDGDWIEKCDFDVKDPKAVKKALREDYAGWAPELVNFTQVADDYEIIPRKLYMLPVGHRWEAKKGVTLIGDAAHLMTPFAGQGVNLAMEDAMKLAEAIKKSVGEDKGALAKGVRVFEEEMFPRVEKMAELTRMNLMDCIFTTDRFNKVVERFATRMQGMEVKYEG